MNIIISCFNWLKDILDFLVALINIYMFFQLRYEKKQLKSKHKYKKRVPSKRKHF